MAEEKPIGSILLADCGAAMTKVVLLEQVAGQYRLVARGEAPTTAEYPWYDVAEGIRHTVDQISQVVGRGFLDVSRDLIYPERPGREGVDVFAATASASPPLKVVLGGLVYDLSVSSLERAAAGTYSSIEAILTKNGRERNPSDEERVHQICEVAPNVICIAGGVEGGATVPVLELVETVALACSLMDTSMRPQVLYAGNSRLRRHVAKLIKKQTKLRVAENVRPILTEENLASAQAELDLLYVQEKMQLLPGIETVSSWSPVPLTPTASAFGQLIQYLWHLGDPDKGVLGVDLGAANTTVAAVFDGRLLLTTRDVGTAFGGEELVQEQGAESLTRWLPQPMSGDEARGLLINKKMCPTSIPQEPRELQFEQALAREAIRATLNVARPGWRTGAAQLYPHLMPLCDTIVVSGGALAHAPNPGQAALIVLDALEPIGINVLMLDVYQIAPMLGKLAAVKPLAAVETLDSGALVNLATVVTPVGHARRGDTVLNAQVTYEDGSSLHMGVNYGDLEVLPLPPGQQAILELRPRRGFDVGLGGPGKGGKQRVSGGLAGLIIDARGRPLRLRYRPEHRHTQVQRWLWDVGG